MNDTAPKPAAPSMLGHVALGKRIPGYHYAYSPDGAFAIEINEPSIDMVTLTWRPGELDNKGATLVVTREVFEAAMRSYFVEFSASKKK